MVSIDIIDILLVVSAWFLATIVSWLVIIPYFFKKYVKTTIVGMLQEPDEATRQAIASLTVQILSVQIKTGRKIKDEDGKETEEVVDFLTYAGRRFGDFVLFKLKGARGGITARANDQLRDMAAGDPDMASLLGMVGGPRKGQSTQEYLLEQLMSRLMPTIEDKVRKALNTSNVDTNANWGTQ